MKVLFHPDFPTDQRKFQADYAEISAGLAARFQREIDDAIAAVKTAPTAAGHFINTGSRIVPEFRRAISMRSRSLFSMAIQLNC